MPRYHSDGRRRRPPMRAQERGRNSALVRDVPLAAHHLAWHEGQIAE